MCGWMRWARREFIFDEVVGIEAPRRAVTQWTGGILFRRGVASFRQADGGPAGRVLEPPRLGDDLRQ